MTNSHHRTASPLVSTESVTTWVNGYLRGVGDQRRRGHRQPLHRAGAEGTTRTPFDTDWVGRDAVVEGWRSRWDWQQGGWTLDWSIASITGPIAVHYRRRPLQVARRLRQRLDRHLRRVGPMQPVRDGEHRTELRRPSRVVGESSAGLKKSFAAETRSL